MENYCNCGTPWVEDDGSCSRCKLPIDQKRLAVLTKKTHSPNTNSPVRQAASRTKDDEVQMGLAASIRTQRYATLFENVGTFFQYFAAVIFAISLVLVLIAEIEGLSKLAGVISICVLWAFTYLQTSLIRGLASYFQMRASDFNIRNWQK